MSKENAIQFLEKVCGNEEAKKLLEGRERPKDRKEQAELFSGIAEKLGDNISPEDFAEALEEMEERIRRRTDSALSDMEAIEDDDLDGVAGGTGDSEKQHSWCVYSDIIVKLKEKGCTSVSA